VPTLWRLQLLKAIEIEGGNAKKILDDRDASITFFAPGKFSFLSGLLSFFSQVTDKDPPHDSFRFRPL
jgi:hypothetical protein